MTTRFAVLAACALAGCADLANPVATAPEAPSVESAAAPTGAAPTRIAHTGAVGSKPTGVTIGEPPTAGTVFHASFGDPIDVGLLPAPEDDGPLTRVRRRVDLDQLDALIRKVSGGLTWDVGGKNQLVELAATLGKPDYLDQTTEDLDPSALFMKFLGDASRSVCAAAIKRDLQVVAADRALMRTVAPTDTWATAHELVEANLQELLLRFHGRAVAVDAPELEHWRWLYQAAELKLGASGAWQAVCVGLMTHPDFYSY